MRAGRRGCRGQGRVARAPEPRGVGRLAMPQGADVHVRPGQASGAGVHRVGRLASCSASGPEAGATAEATPKPQRAEPHASGPCSTCVRRRAALDVRTPERTSQSATSPRGLRASCPGLPRGPPVLGLGAPRGVSGTPSVRPPCWQRYPCSPGIRGDVREQVRGGCRETLRPLCARAAGLGERMSA